ncbi:hypothetical protein BsWGS_28426 [Bradybaena similaris]
MATDTECVVHLLLLCGISSFGAGQEIKTGICYQGWHYYQKHSYGLGGDQVTWADAEPSPVDLLTDIFMFTRRVFPVYLYTHLSTTVYIQRPLLH